MDPLDFERRAAEVLSNMVLIGDDGVARPSPELGALQRDIAAALKAQGEDAELRDLEAALGMMQQSLADPDVAKQLALAASSHGSDPWPDAFEAIEACDVAALRIALETEDVNARVGEYNATALYRAMSCATGCSLEIMDLLLDAGADPRLGLTDCNVLHGLGFANLRGIAAEDLARVVLRCVASGADIEARTDKLQWTPLMTAASEWNPVAVEALLLAGADISARAGEVQGVCFSGSDCLAFAQGHAATLAVLERYRGAH